VEFSTGTGYAGKSRMADSLPGIVMKEKSYLKPDENGAVTVTTIEEYADAMFMGAKYIYAPADIARRIRIINYFMNKKNFPEPVSNGS
jgi:hypothetical protein